MKSGWESRLYALPDGLLYMGPGAPKKKLGIWNVKVKGGGMEVERTFARCQSQIVMKGQWIILEPPKMAVRLQRLQYKFWWKMST